MMDGSLFADTAKMIDLSGLFDRPVRFAFRTRNMNSSRALAAAIIIYCASSAQAYAQANDAAKYVGVEICAGCHQTQAERWKTSHHALAMEKATPATVLGDFSGVSVENFGVVSTFSRVGDKFVIRTDGPDGSLHDYEITYTFGIDPLQQYLIGFPDGRYQVLGLAWDTRPKDKGGQRWFHLYPDQKLQPGSLLHWTGRDQNWNYQCADCHTTDLKKNFDIQADKYATSWASLGVTCESAMVPDLAMWRGQRPDLPPRPLTNLPSPIRPRWAWRLG